MPEPPPIRIYREGCKKAINQKEIDDWNKTDTRSGVLKIPKTKKSKSNEYTTWVVAVLLATGISLTLAYIAYKASLVLLKGLGL